jgi:hypothetical protein
MKLNWGHKLVFFAVLFMLFVVYMVYRISIQKVDLVDKNYYEKGVRYQEEINKYQAASFVNPSIEFSSVEKKLTFKANTPLKGMLYFYRPGDEKMDFEKPFELDANNQFIYNTSSITRGNWKVIFEWTLQNKLMAAEKQLILE